MGRIVKHIDNRGGPEAVINHDGDIRFDILDYMPEPTKHDLENYECID